jgi:hypothetical protein
MAKRLPLSEEISKKLAFKDEQLKGKRALWMDSHLGSSARRDAMSTIRNPFTSPTTEEKVMYLPSEKGYLASRPFLPQIQIEQQLNGDYE